MADIINILRQVSLLANLPDERLQQVAAQGTQLRLQSGGILVRQGEPFAQVYILLAGEVEFTARELGDQEVHVINLEAGAFFGPELFLLDIRVCLATGRAVRDSHLFQLDETVFWQFLAPCPAISRQVLRTAAQLWQNYQEVLLEQSKLNALSTLSAGLAHELNNPVVAVLRGAKHLEETLQVLPSLSFKLPQKQLTQSQLNFLADLPHRAAAQIETVPCLDSLAQSDQEEQVIDWLKANGVRDGWKLAPSLVEAGLDPQWLDTIVEQIPHDALGDVLTWLEVMLRREGLLSEIKQAAARISSLVSAVKEYSYMDRMPLQEVDLHEGLESTLKILDHKLKPGVTVIRKYDRRLPCIYAYGRELNQVWTNLIDNAIDAMKGQGKLWISTRLDKERVFVEIADSGPGIPPEIQARIFEPFFTTKEIGKGTGIGLDLVRRIIVGQHKGSIRVFAKPGNTCFQVCFPMNLYQ